MNLVTFLHERGIRCEVIPHPTAFDAQHLAHELHVTGYRVAKAVLLRADHGFRYVVAVVPAVSRIDLAAVSKVLGGSHVELATEIEIAERCPDCEMGVLPPLGSIYGLMTLVDESLSEETYIYFDANTHSEAIRMKFEDFRRIEQPVITTIVSSAPGMMVS